MSTQQLDIILAAKNQTDQAFNAVVRSMKTTEVQVSSTTDRMGMLADGVGRMSTTLARSADTLGLPTQALRALDDVADVAELGLRNLTTTTLGFNAATIGLAGAAAAGGAAIGTMMRNLDVLPGIPLGKWLDDAVVGFGKWAGLLDNLGPKLSAYEQKTLNAAVAAEKLAEKQALMNAGSENVSAELLRQQLEIQATARALEEEEKAWQKKQKASEEAARAAVKASEEAAAAAKRAVDLQVEATNYFEREAKESWEAVKDAAVKANEFVAKDTADKYSQMQAKVKEFAEQGIARMRSETEAANETLSGQLELFGHLSDSLSLASELFDRLGLSGSQAFNALVSAGNSALGVLESLASGDLWGAILNGINGLLSLFDFFDFLFGGPNPYDNIQPFPPGVKPTNPLPDDIEPGGGGGGDNFAGGNSGFYGGGSTTIVVPVQLNGREIARQVVTNGTRRRQGRISPGAIRSRA